MPIYSELEIESANITIKNILNQYNTKSMASEYRSEFKRFPAFIKYVPNEYSLPTYQKLTFDEAKRFIGLEVNKFVKNYGTDDFSFIYKSRNGKMALYGYEPIVYQRHDLLNFVDNDVLDLIRMLYTLKSTLEPSRCTDFPIIERFREYFNISDFVEKFNFPIMDYEYNIDNMGLVAYNYLKDNGLDIRTNITNYFLRFSTTFSELSNLELKSNTLSTYRFFKKIIDTIQSLPNEELIYDMYKYVYEQFFNFIASNNIIIRENHKIFITYINFAVYKSNLRINPTDFFFKEKYDSTVEDNDKFGIGQYLFDKYFDKKEPYYPFRFSHYYKIVADDSEREDLVGVKFLFIRLGGYRVGVLYKIENHKLSRNDYTGFYFVDCNPRKTNIVS